MVNPSFLKLKKHLTLDEARQYIAHHLRRKAAGNSEILFLINEGFLSCFLDCPLEATDDVPSTRYINEEGRRYEGYCFGLQKLVNPQVGFFYDKSFPYNGNTYYTNATHDLIGGFIADFFKRSKTSGDWIPEVRRFKQVTQSSYMGVCESKNCLFKAETVELIRVLEQFNPEDFTSHHDVAQLQDSGQSNRLLAEELAQAKEEIIQLKARLLNTPTTNATHVAVGALIELLTEQKAPRRNQSRIKDELEEKGLKGLSRGSLNDIFSAANKALKASKDGV